MSWAVGMRAVVLEDNIFDRIREGMNANGRDGGEPWAGCFGHVVGVRDTGASEAVVDVRLEGSVHGRTPESVPGLKYWSFMTSEIEHAD